MDVMETTAGKLDDPVLRATAAPVVAHAPFDLAPHLVRTLAGSAQLEPARARRTPFEVRPEQAAPAVVVAGSSTGGEALAASVRAASGLAETAAVVALVEVVILERAFARTEAFDLEEKRFGSPGDRADLAADPHARP